MKLILCFSFVGIRLFSQSDLHDQRLEVINFGLESEIVSLVAELRNEENDQYNDQLIGLFPLFQGKDFRESLLSFSILRDIQGLEEETINMLLNPEDYPNSTLFLAMEYLVKRDYQDAIPIVRDLVEGDNQILAQAAIRNLGKFNATDYASDLLTFLEEEELEENFTSDLIWALGELKYEPALDYILDLIEDTGENTTLRESAIKAVGQFIDSEAKELLLELAYDENVRIGSAALAALSGYDIDDEIKNAVLAKLRDSDPTYRKAAMDFLIENPFQEASPLVLYRLENDPEAPVRQASFKALESIDESQFKIKLTEILENSGSERFSLWKYALDYSRQNYPELWEDFLPQFIMDEASKPNSILLQEGIAQLGLWPSVDAPNWFGNLFTSQNEKLITFVITFCRRKRWSQFYQPISDLQSNRNALIRSTARSAISFFDSENEAEEEDGLSTEVDSQGNEEGSETEPPLETSDVLVEDSNTTS